jgi:hypothetical protein
VIDMRPREYERLRPPPSGNWFLLAPPECIRDGCIYGKHVQDGRVFFVHESPRRCSMVDYTEYLRDVYCDIWQDVAVPWINRLHAEDAA